MKNLIFLLSLLSILLLVSGCIISEQTSRQRILTQVQVLEVVDGDTIKIEVNGTIEYIRLLHENTPEKGEKCYQEAKDRLNELVGNKTVWLERDMQDEDKYGRKLRYIFLSPNTNPQDYNDFANLIMLREGYASMLIIEPDTKYQPKFEEALNKASQEEGCIWGSKSSYAGCFVIENFHPDAQGDDCKNANDEYVILKNLCQDIDMKDWTIKDSARHVYTFKDFTAKANFTFILHSGSGQDNTSNVFWNQDMQCPSIWNNDHDTLFLRDIDDKLVLQYIY